MPDLKTEARVAVTAVAALILTSCADEEGPQDSPPRTSDNATTAQEPEGTDEPEDDEEPVELVEPAWEIEADLVGSPAMADGVVVSYIRNEDNSFDAVAWHIESQEELWRIDAATGDPDPLHTVTLEDSIGVYDGGHYVAFLQEADEHNTAVAVDLHSGEQVVDQPVYAYTRPVLCEHSDNACFDGQAGAMDAMRTLQLHPNTGEISQLSEGDAEGALPPGHSIRLDNSLYIDTFTNTEDTELVYAPEGEPVWESSYHTIFGEGFSAQRSWNYQIHESAPELIGGWARNIPAEELAEAAELLAAGQEADPVTIRLSEDVKFVMLEETTGEPVWEEPGLDDCPGGGTRNQGDLMVLCHWSSGEFAMDPETGDFADDPLEEESMDVLGVEPATGEVAWSVPVDAGSLGNIVSMEDSNIRQTPGQILASADGEPIVIDTEDGETRPADEDETFLCSAGRDGVVAQRQSGQTEASAGHDLFLCDSFGGAVGGESFPLHLLEAAAAADNDAIALVGFEGRLVAYDISETSFNADGDDPTPRTRQDQGS